MFCRAQLARFTPHVAFTQGLYRVGLGGFDLGACFFFRLRRIAALLDLIERVAGEFPRGGEADASFFSLRDLPL